MGKRTFYISDMHIGGSAAMRWDAQNDPSADRFSDANDKTEQLIARWNSVVRPTDHVYILGDMFSCSREKAEEILKRLSGGKFIVMGNHDRAWLKEIAESGKYGMLGCADYLEHSDEGRKVILSHYPIAFWNDQHKGAYHLYGHVHNSKEAAGMRKIGDLVVSEGLIHEYRAINCGAMLHKYTPRTLDELISEAGLTALPRSVFSDIDKQHRSDENNNL